MSVKVEITAANSGLKQGFDQSRDIVRNSVADMNRELGKLAGESSKQFGRAREEVSKFAGSARTAGAANAGLGASGVAAGAGFSAMLGPLAAVAAGIAAITVVARGAVAILGEVVQVQREFDKISAGLITATGSADKANEAFGALQDFATKTPYSLQEVSEGFVKLVNLGLTPSERALTSYGNTAAAMGKSLNQMIEAVADASTGEFERLKEFGIKASTEGDQITFRFRGVSETVRNEAGAIEQYLLRLGETNFDGAMTQRMDTLDGAMSNLSDEWNKLILNLSQTGLGEAIEESVRLAIDLLAELNAYVASGQFEGHLEAMAEAWGPWLDDGRDAIEIIRSEMGGLGDFLEEIAPGMGEALFAPWRDFPANVRAVIQMATVYVANGLRQMVTLVEANVATIKAIFSDDTVAEARARGFAAIKANQSAFEESIRVIVQERNETIASTKAAIDGANARREAYERERAAKAGDTSDKLAGYKQGGDGSSGESKSEAAARARAAKEAEREAERARKEAFQVAMETLRQELDEWRNNYDERIRIARAMAEEVKKQYGENSAEYKKAQRQILDLEREKAEQIRQIGEVEKAARIGSAMAAIDAAEMAADRDYQIGVTSFQQRIAIQMQFEAERFAIQRQAFEERLAMMALDPDMNPVEFARIKSELLEIEQQHQQRIAELRNRATVDAAGGTTNFFGAMETQFSNAMTAIITRQQSAGQVLRSAWQSLYASFVQEMVVKPLIQWGIRVLKETALGKLLFGQQIAQQAAASAATIGTKSAETTAVVGMNAAQAGAGAAASQASIPFVGPVLALAAMAAVFAAVSALAGGGGGSKTTTTTTTLPSAANGFDIPAGVNPLTQLHEREMVLPAEQADVIRDMAGGGGGGGGGPIILQVSAMDSNDVRRFLLQNKGAVADALKAAVRDFKR